MIIRGWLIVLGLGIAALVVDGKVAAQAPSVDHQCSIIADPHWTKPEAFVWNNICVGMVADFNTEPGYGGAIDPKRPEGLPDSRVLTSAFIESVLLNEKYRQALSALTHLDVVIVGARFTDPIDLANANLGYDLSLNDSVLEKGANFRGLRSLHELSLRGSKISGILDMAELHTEQLDLSKSRVTGKLIMNYLEAGDGLFMDEGEFNDVYLRKARIEKEFDLSKAKIAGQLDMERMTVTGGVFLGEGAEVGGSIYFVFGKCESLELAGGTFHQNMDLTGTQITSELTLGSSRFGPAHWLGTPSLILRNVTADAIQDLSASWPTKVDLVGFTYRNLGGLDDEISDPIADRDVEWFVDWLGRSHYSPQPYEQLAGVLRAQGRPGEADRILYAGRERERLGSSGLDYLWQSVLKIVIGYGYRVWLAVVWLVELWLIGALVQWTRPAARNNNVGQLLLYSFEMLLPVIRLRGQSREFRSGLQDIWFHIQSVLSLVLTAFLAAGLAGLTK